MEFAKSRNKRSY